MCRYYSLAIQPGNIYTFIYIYIYIYIHIYIYIYTGLGIYIHLLTLVNSDLSGPLSLWVWMQPAPLRWGGCAFEVDSTIHIKSMHVEHGIS